jgi:hypothetical protein
MRVEAGLMLWCLYMMMGRLILPRHEDDWVIQLELEHLE